MKDSRIPLHPGTLLRIRDWIIRIDSQAGRGTTCLAYYGSVLDGEGQVLRLVVIKEFWPLLAGTSSGPVSAVSRNCLFRPPWKSW